MNRHYFVLITAALMFAIGGIAGYLHHRHSVDEAVQKEEVALEAEDAQEQQQVQPADPPPVESKIGKNENFTAALQHAGFNTADAGATYPYRGRGVTIPTLAEVYARFPTTRVNIEIKEGIPNTEERLWRVIQSHQAEDRTLTDNEVDRAHKKIEDRLRHVLKAMIRGKE